MPIDDQQLQDQINRLLTAQPTAMPTGTPDDGTRPSWTGLLGSVLSGGQTPGYRLRGGEADTAGNRALLNFGIQTLLASGPAPVRPDVLSAVASGLQGAQQSMDVDQRRAGALAAAQQEYATKQQELQLARLKEALPLLTFQQQQAALAKLKGEGSTSTATTPGATDSGFTGDKTKDLALIAKRESGGDPTATNYVAKEDPTAYARGATASGKYQIVNSTWAEGMRLAGLDPAKYATARDAPEAVQDQVASVLYDKYGTKPWQKGAKDWVKDESGHYQLATVSPGPGAPAVSAAPPGGGVAARTGGTNVAGPGAGPTAPAPAVGDLVGPRPLPPTGPGSTVATPASLANTPMPAPGVAPVAPAQAPAMATPPPFQMRPLTPTEAAATSYELPPDVAAEIARDKQNATTVPEYQAAAAKENAAKLAQREKADAARLTIERDARKEQTDIWQKQQEQRNAIEAERIKQEAAAQAAIDADARKQRDAIRLKEIEKDFDRDKEGARVTFDADKNRLTKSGEDANNKQMIGNQLRQVRAVLPGLPNGVIASIIGEYPQLTTILRHAGVLSPQQATDAQLIQGMTNFLATEIKPLGTGSMQVAEMNTFKTVLPTLLQTPEGRVKALAFLQNVNDRGVAEHDFAQQYFRRIDPATGKPAYNLDGLPAAINKPRQEGGLGPVIPAVPRYTNPATAEADAEKWLNDNVEVGHPFMGWGYPLDKHTGKPLVIDPQTGKKNALVPQLMVREN